MPHVVQPQCTGNKTESSGSSAFADDDNMVSCGKNNNDCHPAPGAGSSIRLMSDLLQPRCATPQGDQFWIIRLRG
jgi:hypothetical protein